MLFMHPCIDSVVPSAVSIFGYADDFKLSCSDASLLRVALDGVAAWASANRLFVAPDKSLTLSFVPSVLLITIASVLIPTVSSVKDLGLVYDYDYLSFDIYVHAIAHCAFSQIGLLFRLLLSHDPWLLRKAFVVNVLPHVEHCIPLGSPWRAGIVDLLKKVQHRFTKRVPCLVHLPYLDHLCHLDFEPLSMVTSVRIWSRVSNYATTSFMSCSPSCPASFLFGRSVGSTSTRGLSVIY